MSDSGDILNRETGLPNHLSSPPRSKDTDVILDQSFGKI